MAGLWADGWFYISAAGLMISGLLFFFLLGQYRAAASASDEIVEGAPPESAEAPAPTTVRPLYVPDEPSPVASVASAEKHEEKAPAATPRDPATTTGGVSPAVVYLQSIKAQLDEVQSSMKSLSQRVDAVSGRDEALIERLGELTQAVAELKSAMVEPPTPKRRRTDKIAAPEPIVEAPAPVPEPVVAAAPAPEPEPTPATIELKVELGPAVGTGPATPAAAPAPAAEPTPSADATLVLAPTNDLAKALADIPSAAAPAPEPEPEEKPRRGPVWPV